MVGLSHQTAPVEFREQVALDQPGIVRTLNSLRETSTVVEAMVLSTCNRTEVYAVYSDDDGHHDELADLLASGTTLPREELDGHVYRRSDRDVVEHLFMVAGGLDSMVIGENQILGQVRDAYSHAVTCRTNGPLVNKLLHRALRVGKQVRTQTGVGEGRMSVAAVACDLAEKIFADLDERTLLMVGAGETGELVARHALDRGIRQLLITNRTYERAEAVAEELGGTPVPWEQLDEALNDTDVLVTSTGATEPVITAPLIRRAVARRKTPLFIIDIAVPRDVDPDVDRIEDVFLYDIDALQEVVKEVVERRRGEVHRARAIVAGECDKFLEWHRRQGVTPTIVQMREQFEGVRQAEIEKLRGKLSDEDFKRGDGMTRGMVNKLLHHPTVQMKQSASKPEGGSMVKALRLLLGLDEEGGR